MRARKLVPLSALFLITTGFGGGDDGGGSGGGGGGGGNQAPQVTIESPTSGSEQYGGRVVGHIEDPDGLVQSATLTVSGTGGSQTKALTLDAQGRFDTSLNLYGVGRDLSFSVTATDDEGAEGSDSVSAKQGCATLTNPNADANSPAIWYGDFFVCGYNTGAHWLTSDPDGVYTEIAQGKRTGWFRPAPDNGSVIVIQSVTGPNAENFSTLTKVRKHFVVQWSTRPNTLNALGYGLQVGGDVVVHYNQYLDDVSGLANLTVSASSPSSIQITHNPYLRPCQAEEVIAELRSRGWGGTALVEGNGSELMAGENVCD